MNPILKKLKKEEGLEYVLKIDTNDLDSIGWDTSYDPDSLNPLNFAGLQNFSLLFDQQKKEFVMHAYAETNDCIFVSDQAGMGDIEGVNDLLQFDGYFR